MKTFAVPKSWGSENSKAIKFKTIKGNLSSTAADQGAQNANNKKKNKNKARKNKSVINATASSVAPKGASTELQQTPKIKAGRIEKKKNAKKSNQKVQITPALKAAAAEALSGKFVGKADAVAVAGSSAALAAKLKEQLMGGRFRYLNEQLYTMNSHKAQALFKQDTDAFTAYHAGYRHQVEKWPINPLNRIAKMITRLPKSLEIGDFGCGEGKLAQMVPNKVHSMDLVSSREDIIACDMASTPLTTQSLDVAVYCLSLMGTNLNDYFLEANRVLKMGGLLYIAEIQSRFDDARQFVRCLESCGFELIKKDASVKLFYFFQFKKTRNVGKVSILQPLSLKPCLYRKR